jgi:putative membrane protein
MKHILSETDKKHLAQRVSETEKLVQSQVVLTTVGKCDSYAEIPWIAFALGASSVSLAVLGYLIFFPVWMDGSTFLISLTVIFLIAALAALATVFSQPFARLFLSRNRAQTETRQYAESFFLNRELFNTRDRMAILILISAFERHVVILPDKGVNNRLPASDLQQIISAMSGLLARNKVREAIDLALDEMIRLMKPTSERLLSNDNFSNEIIEEKGL